MRYIFPTKLEHLSLNQVDAMYREGRVSRDEVEEYVKGWNATPFRFSEAKITEVQIITTLRKDNNRFCCVCGRRYKIKNLGWVENHPELAEPGFVCFECN